MSNGFGFSFPNNDDDDNDGRRDQNPFGAFGGANGGGLGDMLNQFGQMLSGMGSSMMLKIKIDQVIKENNLPVETEHGNLDSLIGFTGDLVITMSDLTDELNADERVPSAIGITNIVDKAEMKQKLEAWLAEHAE